jgi:REP element-mobilizing transposase RayT
MTRRNREDASGTWHHVVNRGIARRPLFESREDIRYFLSRLAREVRRGRVEVHAWCILTTHFHLLVRSRSGELSEAMRRVQNEYCRWFNRRRQRDGTLTRGRFFSKPVRSLSYRRTLVRYIDANPVQAGLVPFSSLYPWCSAHSYARSNGPRWLERSWIEEEVRRCVGRPAYRVEDYPRVFGCAPSEGLLRVIESRIARPTRPQEQDPLDDLIGAAPANVRDWMERKTKLADGTALGLPICDGEAVACSEAVLRAKYGDWNVSPRNRERDAWSLARVGLMRHLSGLTWAEIARVTSASPSSCHEYSKLHGQLVREDPIYLERVAEWTSLIMELVYGGAPFPSTSQVSKYGVAPLSSVCGLARDRRRPMEGRGAALGTRTAPVPKKPEESGTTPYVGRD